LNDESPDPARDRERFAERLREAGLDDHRFIDVRDGEKGTRTPGHNEPENWEAPDAAVLSGNYGVHPGAGADGGAWLIEFDKDDYHDTEDTGAIDALPDTFGVKSPHTPDGESGHDYYKVKAEDIEVLKELTGTYNPEPAWGEIKAKGKYVVGPGSQLDGCTKEWCEECVEPDGGYYRIAADRSIATLNAEQLAEVIRADADPTNGTLGDSGETGGAEERSGDSDPGDDGEESTSGDGESGVGVEAPETMPECYRRALETRVDPSDATVNEHEVSKHAALLGLWGGYDADDVVDHMTGEYAPGDDAGISTDDDETEYQVEKLEKKTEQGRPLRPPSVETLRRDGILDDDPDADEAAECAPDCLIHSVGGSDADADGGMPGFPEPTEQGLEVREGCYGYEKSGDDGPVWVEVANFQLKAESFLVDANGEDSVELTVRPSGSGDSYTVTVDMTVFNNVRTFRNKVVTQRSTAYSGGMSTLNSLRKFIGNQDAPVRVGVDQLGLHGREWVTPDGVLTADGWTSDPDHVYRRSDTPIEQQWDLDPDEWPDGEFDRDTVASILELLPPTRESDRFLPVLGWWYAAAFRPLVMEWAGQFPILNVSGETGAGKTGTFNVLSQLFALGTDPQAATGTTFPKLTSIGSSNAVPVWLDEYKPAGMADYRVDALHNHLRKSTRGATAARGNPDGSSDLFALRAPVCITGEQLVSGPAEERRAIQTTFSEQPSSPETDMYRCYKELVGGAYTDPETERTEQPGGYELKQHAVAYLQWVLRRVESTDTLHQWWREAGKDVAELLAKHDITGLNDDVADGFQVIRFGCMLYRRFAAMMGADPGSAGVNDEAIDSAIMYVAQAGGGVEQLSHTERLLSVASRAAATGGNDQYLVEDEHYRLLTPSDREREELRLKLGTGFDQIRRYASEHSVADGDLLGSAEDYRDRIQNAADDPDSTVIKSSVVTRGLNRSVAFDIERAEQTIRGVERMLWTDDTEQEDRGGDGPASPINEVSAEDAGRYVTLTARVNDVNRPNAADAPTQVGTLVDRTGPIDLVCWDSSPFDLAPNEHYRFEDVEIGQYQNAAQAKLVNGVTSVEPITPGDGYTEAEGEDGADTDGDAAVGDLPQGERVEKIQKLVRVKAKKREFKEAGGVPRAVIIEAVAGNGVRPDDAERTLDRLVTDGQLVEGDEGRVLPP